MPRLPVVRFDETDERVLERRFGLLRRAHRRLQPLRRVDGDAPAAIDQRHPVAVFRFVHEMGRHHDGDAARHHRVDEAPELAAGQRVDAGGRFVEKQHRRLVHDRAGQGEPLLEAERQRAGVDVEARPEVEGVDHAGDGLAAPGAGEAVGAGEELEILAHAEIAVERKLLRHVAQARARRRRRSVEIQSVDFRRALARLAAARTSF